MTISLYGITDLAIAPINLLNCIRSAYDDNPAHQGYNYDGTHCHGLNEVLNAILSPRRPY